MPYKCPHCGELMNCSKYAYPLKRECKKCGIIFVIHEALWVEDPPKPPAPPVVPKAEERIVYGRIEERNLQAICSSSKEEPVLVTTIEGKTMEVSAQEFKKATEPELPNPPISVLEVDKGPWPPKAPEIRDEDQVKDRFRLIPEANPCDYCAERLGHTDKQFPCSHCLENANHVKG